MNLPRLRHPLIVSTLIACGAMLLVLVISPRWMATRIAADLRQRIDAADEGAAVTLVEQLARLDDASLQHLVDLLDDQRRPVRVAVREAIRQKLEMWSDQRSAASERSVVLLANCLAAHEGPRDLHSRVFVKLTALKLLRWPLEASTTDRIQFLADCSALLERMVDAHVDEPEVTRRPEQELEPALAELADSHSDEPRYEPVAELPGEPVESDPAPALLPSGEEQPLPPARIEVDAPRRIRSSEIKIQSDFVDEQAQRSLPTRSVIRQLQGIPAMAESAERELRRRGFDDVTLKLARALDDPDPRIREQLADSLPRLASIDPAPWLWELAEDEDENVRRTARGILTTSSNPKTRARVVRLR